MSPNANILQQHTPMLPDNIKYLALRSAHRQPVAEERRLVPILALLLVVTAHLATFYWLQAYQIALPKIEPVLPMMVSLLPSPQPEMAQIIPTPKPVVQKPQPKIEKPIIEKVVQQPQPVPQTEAEQVVHQPPPPTEAKPNNSITPVAERSPVTEPKIEKVEEPKIEPPRFGVAYLKNPPPEYPLISRRLGEKGHVMLKVLVNAAGEAESVALETGSGSDRLDQAAIEAVKKWRFVPAKRNGQALSAYVLVPLNFGLSG